jgi:hypothetical protein
MQDRKRLESHQRSHCHQQQVADLPGKQNQQHDQPDQLSQPIADRNPREQGRGDEHQDKGA